jgi:hypothetical protein
MRVTPGTIAPVRTACVITLHRFSLIPQLQHGQLDTYNVVPMRGTAQHVVF